MASSSSPPPSLAPAGSPSSPELLAHVSRVWDRIRPDSAIYAILFSPPHMRIVSAAFGRVVAHFGPLAPVHLNSKNTLHGSVSGAAVDWAGGMAIAATGLDRTGVSTDMHLSFVSGARLGDVLEVEAWVSRAGGSLGFTNVEIRKMGGGGDGSKGQVVVTASHTKYLRVGKETGKQNEGEPELAGAERDQRA